MTHSSKPEEEAAGRWIRMKCEFHHQVCVTNEPLFLYWISYCLHLPWTLWTITIAHTLTAMARSTMRSLSVTTAYSFIADRHIPQDWMSVSSTASRCHWFVRVRRLGHNWSLQPGSPCLSECLTCGDRIQRGLQTRMQVTCKSKAGGPGVWNGVSQSQLQQCDPITSTM